MSSSSVINGNSLEVMAAMPEACVDSIVTDPPYELGFMGKRWDNSGIAYSVALWTEALRVLKPGGHLLAFGGTRTYHRMTVAIEDAGFEIRDSISWLYGSGFPKSLDVSKAIDRSARVERERIPTNEGIAPGSSNFGGGGSQLRNGTKQVGTPLTRDAKQWHGWGTALKPACEPIVVARKPLVGTVAENVLEHGTGALNIDGCRIGTTDDLNGGALRGEPGEGPNTGQAYEAPTGRWPANVILDPDAADELDRQSGVSKSTVDRTPIKRLDSHSWFTGDNVERVQRGDSGGASRFFYVAKPSKAEKLAGVPPEAAAHPTVKPVALMRYLIRLVTPPGGGRDGSVGTGVTVGGVLGKPDHRQSGGCTAVSRIPGLFGVLVRKLSPAAILRPFFAGMNPKVPTW